MDVKKQALRLTSIAARRGLSEVDVVLYCVV